MRCSELIALPLESSCALVTRVVPAPRGNPCLSSALARYAEDSSSLARATLMALRVVGFVFADADLGFGFGCFLSPWSTLDYILVRIFL